MSENLRDPEVQAYYKNGWPNAWAAGFDAGVAAAEEIVARWLALPADPPEVPRRPHPCTTDPCTCGHSAAHHMARVDHRRECLVYMPDTAMDCLCRLFTLNEALLR